MLDMKSRPFPSNKSIVSPLAASFEAVIKCNIPFGKKKSSRDASARFKKPVKGARTNNVRAKVFPRRKKGELERSNSTSLSLTLKDVKGLFHLRQSDAARTLGISLTAMKNACRRLGIWRWPYSRQRPRGSATTEGSGCEEGADSPEACFISAAEEDTAVWMNLEEGEEELECQDEYPVHGAWEGDQDTCSLSELLGDQVEEGVGNGGMEFLSMEESRLGDEFEIQQDRTGGEQKREAAVDNSGRQERKGSSQPPGCCISDYLHWPEVQTLEQWRTCIIDGREEDSMQKYMTMMLL